MCLEEDPPYLLGCAWFTNTIDCRWCSGQSPSDLWRGLNTSLSRERPLETLVILCVQPYTSLSDTLIKWQQKKSTGHMDKHFLLLFTALQNLKIQLEDRQLCWVNFYSSMDQLTHLAFVFLQRLDIKKSDMNSDGQAGLCALWFFSQRTSDNLACSCHIHADLLLLLPMLCIVIGVINQQSC